jgi:nucleoside-diphosphate-sugar epimerase
MPAHNANLRAEGLLAQWNFPNNYTLSKHLAEYMVADYQQHANLPVAIVRPTLISSVARDPYPGEPSILCAMVHIRDSNSDTQTLITS